MYYANCHHLSYVCWQGLKKRHSLGSKFQAGKFSEEFNKFCLTVLKNSVRSQSKFCPGCCLHDVLTAVIPLCNIWAL